MDEICVDPEYERKISKIILYPLNMRIEFFAKRNIGALIRKLSVSTLISESVIGLELISCLKNPSAKLDEIVSNMWCLYGIFMVVYCSGHYHMVTSSSVALYMMLPFACVSLLMYVHQNGLKLPKHSGLFLLFCIFTAAVSMLANFSFGNHLFLLSLSSCYFFTAFAIRNRLME